MGSNPVLGAVVTVLLGALLLGMGINFWIRSVQPLRTKKIKEHGVETTAEIKEVRNKTLHLTKVAYMMNIEYETPQGTFLRKYQRTMTKDRIRHYEQIYGACFCRGMEIPIAFLPEDPNKFIVLHPIEVEEKKRTNILVAGVILAVFVLPVILWFLSGLTR